MEMTLLEELLEKLDGLIESLGGQLSAALLYGHSNRLAETFIDLDGNAVSEIVEALRQARAIVGVVRVLLAIKAELGE